MAHFERIRDVVSGPASPEIIQQRTSAGWQMVSIEWRRELPDSETPSEGAYGEDLGLTKDWAARIIRHVGNYGEVYERNVGSGSKLGIPRGLNQLWSNGGILYAPPIR